MLFVDVNDLTIVIVPSDSSLVLDFSGSAVTSSLTLITFNGLNSQSQMLHVLLFLEHDKHLASVHLLQA